MDTTLRNVSEIPVKRKRGRPKGSEDQNRKQCVRRGRPPKMKSSVLSSFTKHWERVTNARASEDSIASQLGNVALSSTIIEDNQQLLPEMTTVATHESPPAGFIPSMPIQRMSLSGSS
ncbi:hypothetical protein CC2G_002779 [Coprinopsis cinerea AmutBmut pab1-1]|nr:hypothetical protein CC2G_002779 [Coprinopsis cinerea AmutBmut pab1-1]